MTFRLCGSAASRVRRSRCLGARRRRVQPVTEIQCWHSMTGALNDRVDEIADQVQRIANGVQGRAGLQGPVRRIDGRGDRRVSRRQPAADRAGVRSRHGDDDGGQGRDQAGVPADGRGRRAVRSQRLSRRGVRRTTRTPHGHLLSMPFNSSTQVLYINDDAFKKAGLDPEQAAEDLARSGGGDGTKLKAVGRRLRFTTGWQSWVQLESFSAWHNVPFATKENGFGGLDTRLDVQRPGAGQAHPESRRLGEEGPVHLQGAQGRAAGGVQQRRVRDDDHVVAARTPTSRPTPSSPGASRRCRTTPTSRARRRTRSSAARRCGC